MSVRVDNKAVDFGEILRLVETILCRQTGDSLRKKRLTKGT